MEPNIIIQQSIQAQQQKLNTIQERARIVALFNSCDSNLSNRKKCEIVMKKYEKEFGKTTTRTTILKYVKRFLEMGSVQNKKYFRRKKKEILPYITKSCLIGNIDHNYHKTKTNINNNEEINISNNENDNNENQQQNGEEKNGIDSNELQSSIESIENIQRHDNNNGIVDNNNQNDNIDDMKQLESSFICNLCTPEKEFKAKGTLNNHLRSVHSITFDTGTRTVICPICQDKLTSYQYLDEHLLKIHQIPVEVEELFFYDEAQFLAWKDQLQIEEFVKYTLRSNRERNFYYCNRSCSYQSRATKRKTKSIKIGMNCPSRIKIKKCQGGGIIARYTKTHIGHDRNPKNKSLTNSQKKEIADKISMGVPNRMILAMYRNHFENNNQSKKNYNMITSKDLSNIRKKFNLTTDEPNTQMTMDKLKLRIKEKLDCIGFFITNCHIPDNAETLDYLRQLDDNLVKICENVSSLASSRSSPKKLITNDSNDSLNVSTKSKKVKK